MENNKKSNLRIIYISAFSPLDKKTWSGTNYRLYGSLNKHFSSVNVLVYNFPGTKILAGISKLIFLIFRKRYNYFNSFFRSFINSKVLENKLRAYDYDLIFTSAGSTEIAFLNINKPIVYLSDTSFGQFADYYDVSKNIFNFSKKESNLIEKKALQNSSLIIYPTDWAKNFSSNFYQISSNKIKKIHLGANLDENIIKYIPKNENSEQLQILFLGVYWERKGGDIVVSTVKKLIGKGINVHLTICGCNPNIDLEAVTIIPFLDKNKHEDAVKMANILQRSHLLFLPTQAECYGIVFNEAAAFGVPSITTNTGGVPEVVLHNKTGLIYDLDASIEDYAKGIFKLWNDKNRYIKMSIQARQNYLESNNWSKFSISLKNEIINLIQ